MPLNFDEIRLARLRLGFSQKNMADELGISQASYSNFENGKLKKEPPLELLERVFAILGMESYPKENPEPINADTSSNPENITAQLIGKLDMLETEIGSLKNQLADYLKSGGGVGVSEFLLYPLIEDVKFSPALIN